MLKKLMKYDMKSLNRFLIIIHAFLLLSIIAANVFFFFFISVDSSSIFFFTLLFLYIFMIAGTSFATSILIAVRFYKNLYSDEGYLTFTLPVTKSQILISKILTGTLWVYINQVFIFVSIATLMIPGKHTIIRTLSAIPGFSSPGRIILGFLLFLLVDAVSTTTMIYASITIGQHFHGHPILGSIVTYFGLQTVCSIIVYAVLFLTGIGFQPVADMSHFSYVLNTLKISFVFQVITSVILYIVTYQMMKKKVNLN